VDLGEILLGEIDFDPVEKGYGAGVDGVPNGLPGGDILIHSREKYNFLPFDRFPDPDKPSGGGPSAREPDPDEIMTIRSYSIAAMNRPVSCLMDRR
jgi:hypothetical protein